MEFPLTIWLMAALFNLIMLALYVNMCEPIEEEKKLFISMGATIMLLI